MAKYKMGDKIILTMDVEVAQVGVKYPIKYPLQLGDKILISSVNLINGSYDGIYEPQQYRFSNFGIKIIDQFSELVSDVTKTKPAPVYAWQWGQERNPETEFKGSSFYGWDEDWD